MIVGGKRIRLIRESLFQEVKDGLTDLGWFASGRKHLPVSIRSKEIDRNEEIPLNTIVLADGGIFETNIEMGSTLAEFSMSFYFDVYAESDAMGVHLAGDIRDLLQGRFTSIRNMQTIRAYDYSLTTPTQFATVQIVGVAMDKAQTFSKPFEEHWYSISVTLEDSYNTESDT